MPIGCLESLSSRYPWQWHLGGRGWLCFVGHHSLPMRCKLRSLYIIRFGAVRSVLLPAGNTQASVALGVFRVDPERCCEIGDGLIEFAVCFMDGTAQEVGIGISRAEPDRLGEISDGFVEDALSQIVPLPYVAAFLHVSDASAFVGLGVFRGQPEESCEAGYGLVKVMTVPVRDIRAVSSKGPQHGYWLLPPGVEYSSAGLSVQAFTTRIPVHPPLAGIHPRRTRVLLRGLHTRHGNSESCSASG